MRRETTIERAKIPAPPPTCSIDGCDDPTAVAFAVAIVYGKTRVGAGSEFIEHGTPKAGVQFERFITRCADCYIRDLYRARKGQRSDIMGTQYEWDLTTLREYWRANGLDEPKAAA